MPQRAHLWKSSGVLQLLATTSRNTSKRSVLWSIRNSLAISFIFLHPLMPASKPTKSLMSSWTAGTERHKSIHRLDSTQVCTANRDGRKERTRRRRSSDRALSRSGAEPPPPLRTRLGAASIAEFSAVNRRGRLRDQTWQAFAFPR